MARKLVLLTALIGVSLTFEASGETLREALLAAETSNPQIGVQRAQQGISQEQLRSARGAWHPNVEFTGSISTERIDTTREFFLNVGNQNIASAQLLAVQPLYAGGRINAGIREARAGIGATDAQLEAVQQDIYLQTVTAYVDVRQDREAIKIQESSVELLSEQFRAAQDRFEVGEITRTDVALAEARLEGARASLSAAQAQAEASQANYRNIVGFEPGDLAPPPPVSPLPQSFDAALERALANSPDIRVTQFAEAAAEQRVATARSRLRPELNFVATAGVQETIDQFQDTSVSAAAQARIPLYQGGIARSQVRSAKLEVAQARLNIEAQRRIVIAQVSQFWYAYSAALVGIEASERQVAAAQIAYEGGIEELAVGVRTTLDVLDQEQDLLEARLGLVPGGTRCVCCGTPAAARHGRADSSAARSLIF